MLKDILTFLRLDYRDDSLKTLYFVVLGINIEKNQINRIIISYKNLLKKVKIVMFKIDVQTFW